MEYTKLDVKRLLYHCLDNDNSEERADLHRAIQSCRLSYEHCTVLSLYMCNLTSFEIRHVLNQNNVLILTSINVLLDEIISMITEAINQSDNQKQTELIKSNSIYNVLANRERVVFIPGIESIKSIQYELSKFDKVMQEALNSTYQYVEDDIQLRRQEEMNIRKRYNFLDYERHYHSVCGIEQVMGDQ